MSVAGLRFRSRKPGGIWGRGGGATFAGMTPSASSTRAVDLRQEPVDEVMERVERALQTSLDRDSVVCKRRTVGVQLDRGTWVRIERRPFARIGVQGWNGTESAALLVF